MHKQTISRKEIRDHLEQVGLKVSAVFTNPKNWKFALMEYPKKGQIGMVLERFPGSCFMNFTLEELQERSLKQLGIKGIPYFRFPRTK